MASLKMIAAAFPLSKASQLIQLWQERLVALLWLVWPGWLTGMVKDGLKVFTLSQRAKHNSVREKP